MYVNWNIKGHEVAKFAAKHLVKVLTSIEAYKKGDYGDALVECFKTLDDLMRTEYGKD